MAITIPMTWSAVTGAAGYNIHAGLVSGAYTVAQGIPGGSVTTGIITVPTEDLWYVSVAAYTGTPPTETEGGYSQEVLVDVRTPTGTMTLGVA